MYAYFDTAPGTQAVSAIGEIPDGGTEAPAFPPRFNPQYEWRWYSSNVGEQFRSYQDGGWSAMTGGSTTFETGTELTSCISLAAMGNPTELGVTTFMMNTTQNHEGSYAGLFAGSFADGYYPQVPITFYLHADFGSSQPPNAPVNRWAYEHTVDLPYDGGNNFTQEWESFDTTSAGYSAYVSWDVDNLYIGYVGPDIAANDSNKWLFAYIDIDPGTSNGASVSDTYGNGTMRVDFPSGFRPDFYWRWRTDNQEEEIQSYFAQEGAWQLSAHHEVTYEYGTYVETAIPWSDLNVDPSTVIASPISVMTYMINEGSGPWTYAGIYSGNFTDGPPPTDIQATQYLQVNLDGRLVPNDPSHEQ